MGRVEEGRERRVRTRRTFGFFFMRRSDSLFLTTADLMLKLGTTRSRIHPPASSGGRSKVGELGLRMELDPAVNISLSHPPPPPTIATSPVGMAARGGMREGWVPLPHSYQTLPLPHPPRRDPGSRQFLPGPSFLSRPCTPFPVPFLLCLPRISTHSSRSC